MKLIGKEEFLEYKKSDTLVIWGSGSSIKNLTKEDFEYLNQFDSVSTTAFSKSKIQTTFYIIGEVLFNYYRAKTRNQKLKGKLLHKLYENAGDGPMEYVNTFKDYTNTCFIIWNDKFTLHKEHFDELDKLSNDYILLKQYGHEPNLHSSGLEMDNSTGPQKSFVDKKLYNTELLLDQKVWLHSWKGINAPIYFAKCMDYKEVIFVGVDLTAGPNSYGYDRKKFVETVGSVIHKGHKDGSIHPCKEMLFKFVNYLKEDIQFSTYTPSLLDEIIPININKHKLIASIATTPTRINLIRETIDSINNQTIKPDVIYINIPYLCEKENRGYEIPGFLYKIKNVIINRFDYDLGPSNKLVPILDIYKICSRRYIITIDDDVVLDKNAFKTITDLLNKGNRIVSNHTWTLKSYINKIKYQPELDKINFIKNHLNKNPSYDLTVSQTKICGFTSDILNERILKKLINNEYPFHYYLGNDVFFGILMKEYNPIKTKIKREEKEYGSREDALCKSSTPFNYINIIYDYCNNKI